MIADLPGTPALDGEDYQRLAALLAERYQLTLVDPAPSGLTRVLASAYQLVLVAPASPDAATSLANTQQWLGAHGHGERAARAVTVVNGVSRRTMEDVLRAESVARGRCRAIVRVPWDDLLATRPGASSTLQPQTRLARVQRQPLYTIAGGMPTATMELGDRVDTGSGWVGPYIGETLGRARSIVHFDPLLAAARNRPTAVAITGQPGAGKTTLAMLLIYQLGPRGATVAVIHPKGDAEFLVEYLTNQGRKARVLPLGSAAPGLLDPFSFGVELSEKRRWPPRRCGCCCRGMSSDRLYPVPNPDFMTHNGRKTAETGQPAWQGQYGGVRRCDGPRG